MELNGLGSALARIQEIGQASAALRSFAATLAAYQSSDQALPVASSPTVVATTPATPAPPTSATAPAAPTVPAIGTLPPAGPPSIVTQDWAEGLPPQGRQWVDEIARAAERTDLDPRLLAALVWTESSFNASAVSPAGAVGLTQLMPTTAAGLHVDPWDPEQNLLGGARFLAGLQRRFGSVEVALAAYNAGPGRVSDVGGVPPETWDYVHRVLDYYETLGGTP
jgi:soluble lytic murein transglycosylase-like protein